MGRALRVVSTVALALFLFAGVLAPLGAVLREGANLNASEFWELSGLAGRTAGQAALSSLLATVIGVWAGLSIGRRGSAGYVWLFPYSVPTVVAASVWVTWLGRTGWLAQLGLRTDWLYSMGAVVLAHVFFNAPWIALRVAQVRREIPAEQEEAARTLGAGPLAVLRRVLWPQLRGAALNGALQTYCLCAMSFVLVLLLGGGPPVDTLETALFARVRYGDLDLPGAAGCALWELIITALPAAWLFARQGGVHRLRAAPGGRMNGRVWIWSVIFVGPYIAAATPGALRGLATPEFWTETRGPLVGSLAMAAATCALTLLAASAALISPSRSLRALGALPSGLSALVLGLGAWLAYGQWLDPFEGSFVLACGIQSVVFFPFAYRWLLPLADGQQRLAFEAARTLGASPWRAWWRIEWPRYRGPVRGAAAIVFAGAVGEASVAQLFAGAQFTPVAVLLSRAVAQYRFEQAQAVALLLLLVSALALGLASGGRGHGK